MRLRAPHGTSPGGVPRQQRRADGLTVKWAVVARLRRQGLTAQVRIGRPPPRSGLSGGTELLSGANPEKEATQ